MAVETNARPRAAQTSDRLRIEFLYLDLTTCTRCLGADVPTLLLYGDNDVRAPLNVAEDIHAAITTSRLVVLPGVGHVINIEAGERFNAELRAFLRQPS